jgi:hypothetical protein
VDDEKCEDKKSEPPRVMDGWMDGLLTVCRVWADFISSLGGISISLWAVAFKAAFAATKILHAALEQEKGKSNST